MHPNQPVFCDFKQSRNDVLMEDFFGQYRKRAMAFWNSDVLILLNGPFEDFRRHHKVLLSDRFVSEVPVAADVACIVIIYIDDFGINNQYFTVI
ncbi:hypothetical protein [Lactiplantibacillus pentosus]|uniref:Uncharacterized protein n=2 Tax=Lactiplantibacillus pentosus TaxID=1589 RepID=A0AAW8WF71_LACPE|nr:hypothetical protein [Lactiplantibacillus pentosus]MDT7039388.1 hypothetical protein [Lactiplantibacillus pentosus]